MGRIGVTELILILIAVLVIFGPSKLPELGRALGRGIKEFKGAAKEFTSEMDDLKKEAGETKKT